jgi:hypothetical protein
MYFNPRARRIWTQKKGQPEGQPDVSVAVQYHQGKHQDP